MNAGMKMRAHRTGKTYTVGGKKDPNYKNRGSSDMRMTLLYLSQG